jgi:hypothetical protein
VILTGAASPGRGAQEGAWCKARPSRAWNRVLVRHVVPLSRTTSVVPWALTHDGRSFFANVYSSSFSGVARIDVRADRVAAIKAFPDAVNDQADGAFDGRWLVWHEYHGFTSFDDFTTWAWDSRTGELRQIGAATRAPVGGFWESPWRRPDVRRGIAAWAQGIGPDGLMAVHVHDLRSGRDLVVRRGHAQGPFLLAGHLVVWPESPAPDTETRMYAASAVTGSRVPPPPALRRVRGISGLATDGRRVAFPNDSYKSLWWSPSLHSIPRKIVAAHGLNYVDNSVRIGGRYIGFGMQPRVFVADTKSHRYIEISGRGGYVDVDRTSLLVAYSSRVKELHPILKIAFVPLHDLPPMPACA